MPVDDADDGSFVFGHTEEHCVGELPEGGAPRFSLHARECERPSGDGGDGRVDRNCEQTPKSGSV